MSQQKPSLEKYTTPASRYRCPACGKAKQFARYINPNTGQHIADNVGKCNRQDSCGYHYTPKQYFEDNHVLPSSFQTPRHLTGIMTKSDKPDTIKKTVSFIDVDVFNASLQAHVTNHFVTFLTRLIGIEVTNELISRYYIGTSKHWSGATVFWQIDEQGKIRTGKIMLYCPSTGKRTKEPYNHIQWVHAALKLPDFELKQCFFGQHLLRDKTKPVAIVESEKTAIIASIYLPQFIWLAAGSAEGLNANKCLALADRNVTLYPDISKPKPGKLSTYEKWNQKANEYGLVVSDLLERKATLAEKEKGLDLADYLLRYDYKAFALPVNLTLLDSPIQQRFFTNHNTHKEKPTKTDSPIQPCKALHFDEIVSRQAEPVIELSVVNVNQVEPVSVLAASYLYGRLVLSQRDDWKAEIESLETYFLTIALPCNPIKLDACVTIRDVALFINSHLATIKANNGKLTFQPFLQRIQTLKTLFLMYHK